VRASASGRHALESSWSNRVRVVVSRAARHTPQFRGKTRLVAACDRRLRRLAPVPDPLGASVDGVRFLLTTSDINDFKVLYVKGFDRDVMDALARAAAARDVVIWDVGANVGAVSLMLAARCPRARIIAIEPSSAVAPRLRANLAANPRLARHVTLLELALTDASGRVPFYESAEPANSGVGRLAPAHNTRTQPNMVAAWSGDDLIASGAAPPPDIIKMDIEGFELPALRGLERHLTETHPVIVFEHEPYRLVEPGNPASPVSWLRALGYTVSIVQRAGRPTLLSEALPTFPCDLVAARAD
jgi:FkbM family methyltransferase